MNNNNLQNLNDVMPLPVPGITSYEEVKQMQNIMSAFDSIEDDGISYDNRHKQPMQRNQTSNSSFEYITEEFDSNQEYMDNGFEVDNSNVNQLLESHYDEAYDFSDEIPQKKHNIVENKPWQSQQTTNSKFDISFIANDDARNSVKKYLKRKLSLYSKEIQEIICLDEKLTSLNKDVSDIKKRYKRCKELDLEEAAIAFNRQYKEAGAEIKILELKLKNLNNSIKQF